jgi:glycyl-tRNA synthetase
VVDAEKNDIRTVLRLHPALAPYKCAVLPLQKNLAEPADAIYAKMAKKFPTTYDVTGSIGKRYRRQDEIGTPFCVTIDFDTLENGTVTVRDRDTMEQIRVSVEDAIKYIESKLDF